LSTSEAEFVADSQAGQEARYLRETPNDFGYRQQNATEIYEDNLACVAYSESSTPTIFAPHRHPPQFRARTRQGWFCQTYPSAHT